ncbi:ABC transporter permease [Aquamicrobium soli]|jgi:simple sugar transport system permease protein|uniref:ABC transporter permease n=1 Tax=Aquamicrobium soli TaxID=1811518 RepID=A0ABV7K9V8_9HYPH
MNKPTAPRTAGQSRGIQALLSSEIGQLSVLTVIIFGVMAALDPSRFLTMGNFSSMAFQFPEFAILSLAMMLSMMTGGIDLSVVGVSNLAAVIAALLLSTLAGPQAVGLVGGGTIALAIAAALLVGTVCGLLNGIVIGIFGLPPILATLGSGLIFTGLAVAITGGSAVLGFPAAFAFLGNGAIVGVPMPLIVFIVVAVIVWLVLERTALGLRIQMLGTNPLAARFAGIDDLAVTVRTYLLSGIFSASAGLVIMSRANSAKADYGSSYLLLSILICVLGGINPYGGFGRVAGLVLAVLSLQFLSSGLNMLQVSNFAKELIWGGLLLAVMVANGIQFRRKRR